MITLSMRTSKFSSTVGRILMVLVFTSMIGGISIAPVYGKDNDKRKGYYKDNGQHRGYYKQGRYGYGRRVYRQPPRHYYYQAPVYAPPPVVYYPEPYQSPGISIIFPLNFR